MFNLSEEAKKFLSKHGNDKVVFTNGCFDILHSGHIQYLNDAKEEGQVLFIGLNSDASVSRLKGPQRPINNESERKFLLENLKAVDFVEIFDEETPYELINKISPQVLVKGGDWKVEDIVGHDIVLGNGGLVKSLSFKDGHSTTNLIQKIQGRS